MPDVNVANTPDVNVANTPSVVVANVPTNPVPVTMPAESLNAVTSGAHVFLNVQCAGSLVLYTVPEGFMLVVEDVNASGNRSSASNTIVEEPGASLSLRTSFDGTFTWTRIAWGNHLPITGGRIAKTYADPESEVRLSVEGCSQPMNVTGSFSGRLIPVTN